eukprot:9154382-Pyramimonas_sp.AAC.1
MSLCGVAADSAHCDGSCHNLYVLLLCTSSFSYHITNVGIMRAWCSSWVSTSVVWRSRVRVARPGPGRNLSRCGYGSAFAVARGQFIVGPNPAGGAY